ncbi:MAG: serine hydrolase, partial [Clostridia bacterium]|nr:serine hydrolase [Clostridia bacterium]
MRNNRLSAFFLALVMIVSMCVPTAYASEASSSAASSEAAPESSTSKYEGISVGDATPEATPEPEKLFSDSEGFICDTLTEPNCESIFMISLDTDTVIYTLNPDKRRPMASLTKIMSYIVAAELIEDLHNTRTAVPQSVADELAGTGSSLAQIQVGEEFSIFELLNLMMVPSGNDAALTIAKYVDSLNIPAEAEDQPFDENRDGIMFFVEMMNRKADEL